MRAREPDLRRDRVTGRLVAVAPGRARRPGAGVGAFEPETQEERDHCPFCAGREDRTPPETLRLPAADEWRVRVVPNLYPAFERHEVVVHSPDHVRSVAELDDEQLDLVAQAWRARADATGGGYVHALVNEGRAAGSSLPHSHSQLVWLPEEPPAVTTERDLEALLDGDAVVERDGLVLLCPRAGRLPYEMAIVPVDPEERAFDSPLLGPALRLLAEAVRRLRTLEGPCALNAWLHDGARWHLEVLPRLSVLAGIELGAGIYLNTLAPETAAAALRAAAP